MELVAAVELDEERLSAFTAKFGIAQGFTDYETALAEVQPDIVHVVTQPARRVWEAGNVRRAPALGPLSSRSRLRFCPRRSLSCSASAILSGMEMIVNCQRRYFHDSAMASSAMLNNEIGEVYLIRASTKGNLMSMGPHTMDLAAATAPGMCLRSRSGRWPTGLTRPATRPFIARRSTFAECWFPGGIRALFDCDTGRWAPRTSGTSGCICTSTFWAAAGVYVTQTGWWYQSAGMAEPVVGEQLGPSAV